MKALILAIILCSGPAMADIIHHGNFPGQIKTVNFSDYLTDKFLPLTVSQYGTPHVRITSWDKWGGVVYEGITLGSHGGAWNADMDGYLLAHKSITFSFSEPVQNVAAFINYISSKGQGIGAVVVSVMSRNGVLLESHAVSIETPDLVNDGKFVGISRHTNDIHQFKIFMRDHWIVMDNLVYSTPLDPLPMKVLQSDKGITPVPEPATLILFLTAIILLLIIKLWQINKENSLILTNTYGIFSKR